MHRVLADTAEQAPDARVIYEGMVSDPKHGEAAHAPLEPVRACQRTDQHQPNAGALEEPPGAIVATGGSSPRKDAHRAHDEWHRERGDGAADRVVQMRPQQRDADDDRAGECGGRNAEAFVDRGIGQVPPQCIELASIPQPLHSASRLVKPRPQLSSGGVLPEVGAEENGEAEQPHKKRAVKHWRAPSRLVEPRGTPQAVQRYV